ncbi:MAG: hypothetical protein Q4G69_05965 [Planctomycetia bacterium]|nr:hypothetical protein [Planctomycetia bacterium]
MNFKIHFFIAVLCCILCSDLCSPNGILFGSDDSGQSKNAKTCSVFPANPLLKKNKKIVLIAGDEEYRSEEAMPQLAKILARHHGFDTAVLYAIDPKSGCIVPTVLNNIADLDQIRDADLVILAIRFRNLPADQMKVFENYLKQGRPLLALRTSTHAFNFPKESPYARYSWNYKGPEKEWIGGFGRKILGETWINHHGSHGKQGTRMFIASGRENDPLFKGVSRVNLPSDVYEVRLPLPDDSTVLAYGAVIDGLAEKDPILKSPKNDPMMPVLWTKSYQIPGGKKGIAMTSTMGCGVDLLNEGFRRLLVNCSYQLLGLEKSIPDRSNVELIGPYSPSPFGFGKFSPNLRPE